MGKEDRMTRAEEMAIRDSFSLNVANNPERLLAIMNGEYRTPSLPGEPEKITRPVSSDYTSKAKTHYAFKDEDEDSDDADHEVETDDSEENEESEEVSRPVISNYTSKAKPEKAEVKNNKYAEVIKEIERFPFLKDPEKLKQAQSVIAKAIRVALVSVVLDEVINNTKKAFKDKLVSAERVPGGIKAVFNFGNPQGKKVVVIAKGAFHGDEIICIHKNEGKTQGAIIRLESGGSEAYSDFTDQFDMKLGLQ